MIGKTRIFRIGTEYASYADIGRAAGTIIKEGGTVAFPTETVYGLGADALNPDAVGKIFEAKARPPDNPLIVHISSTEQLHDLVEDIPARAFDLMDAFWPGPLTMIFKRKEVVPEIITAGLDTVAVRMPDNPIALLLIEEAGTPIAAPSANRSGMPSPTTTQHVISDLDGRIDAVIDGGAVKIGVESTVVDMTSETPVLLRPGGIGIDEISDVIGKVAIGYLDRLLEEGEVARSPGMRYTHYSPKTWMVLVSGNSNSVVDRISKFVSDYNRQGLRVGLLATEETAEHIIADEIFILGGRDDIALIASNLFAGIRYLDGRNVDVIIADGSMRADGIGAAVQNRLKKAADEEFANR
ncbi:MAG: threonylcarbamoyl-AMP synthase [Candidatus Methanogaster sp.]|uniref:Threonylcarbamoyl-AMP synthase n=1 Tax=Candidatus Methanogaster sp. TaxID=3386292 RepID=A0AC61L6F7_9EURY|nr:MAG: threonylcarbamoyl-AMP synthase [ANME-2 cluster archaeon]